jgi:hypothetical protein
MRALVYAPGPATTPNTSSRGTSSLGPWQVVLLLLLDLYAGEAVECLLLPEPELGLEEETEDIHSPTAHQRQAYLLHLLDWLSHAGTEEAERGVPPPTEGARLDRRGLLDTLARLEGDQEPCDLVDCFSAEVSARGGVGGGC